MLDLFTRVLNFGEAKSCRGAFQEVPERAELVKVGVCPMWIQSVS